jgi:DNA-binding transcriptional LysR family regulator
MTLKLIRRNDVDIGIVPLPRSLPSDLVFHAWRTFRAYVLVPKGHPLTMRRTPTIEDILTKDTLSQFPQVITTLEDGESDRVRDGLERLGLPFNVALEVGDLNNVKHYAANGHGLAAVNGVCLAEGDEKKFHLVEIPGDFGGTVTYGVLLHKDKYLSRALRRLLELLGVSGN